MPLITLITDRKADDFFIGRLKGQLFKHCANLNIVDLAHNIKHHSTSAAAFALKNSFQSFPDNSIHIIAVDGEHSDIKTHLIAQVKNQYFITADNGLLSLVFEPSDYQNLIRVKNRKKTIMTQPALFTFGEIASQLINGKGINEFGEPTQDIKRIMAMNPICETDFIVGNVIYTDSYGNAVSNITFDLFNEVGQGRKFIIFAGSNAYKINKISYSYNEVEIGNFLAVFNSFGLLEIAMNKGEIFRLLNFNTKTKIRIEFL